MMGASSVLALVAASPSLARFPRGASSGFNGGKTQGQAGIPAVGSNDYPFLNLLKGGDTWQGTDSFNNNQKIDPTWLSADGWPNGPVINAASVSGNGVYVGLVLPSPTSYTGNPGGNGNLRIVWTVTGAGSSDTLTWSIQLMSSTAVSSGVISGSGSVSTNTSTGNGTFYYEFTPAYDNPFNSLTFHLVSTGTAHATNAALVFAGQDFNDYQTGKIFGRQFVARLTQAKFGVFRFMDWLETNVTNASLWATRKSQGYVTWFNDEYRAALSVGVTSGNTGNDYSITIPGAYVWPGYTTGGAAVDKQTMHMRFNASATFVNNTQAGNLTIASISPLTFTWPSLPLSNGDPVCIYVAGNGNQIGGTSANVAYYVVGVSGNNFNVALTSGGSAITASDFGQGGAGITRLPTLKIDGTHKIPIMGPMGQPLTSPSAIPIATDTSGTAQVWATLNYDAALNCWLMNGATTNVNCAGLMNVVPPEVCFALCKQLGMHPHFSLPGFAMDPPTDYARSLAAYCQSNNPGWMIPHYEPMNEIWNPTPVTAYAAGKAFTYWNTAGSLHDWYGMALSMMGQDIAAIYGAGNLGTTYEVMLGVKSADGLNPPGGSENPRITTNQWTTQNQPARSGYTISVASGWASVVLPATYTFPSMQGTPNEYLNAWQYFFVNGGISTNPAAMQNLNNYADTLGGIANPLVTNGSTSTSSAILHVASVPAWVASGWTVFDFTTGQTIGTISTFGTTTITLTGNAASAVGSGDALIISANPSATPGNNPFWAARYYGFKQWAAGFGVNKMFAYEGGYSPDIIPPSGRDWQSQITAATNATQCVLTLPNTSGGDPAASNNGISGNPAQIGQCLYISGVSGMTQLNTSNASSGPTFTIGQSVISLTNSFVANQGIVFTSNPLFGAGTPLPTNIQPDTPYFILSAGLTSSQFQISTTKGGSPIVFTAPSGTTTINAAFTWYSGWMVTNVSGNSVTIDCNSSGFGTFTGTATADYAGSRGLVNDFRIAVLQFASDLPAQLKANYDNFVSAGGQYPSQYEIAGAISIWFCLNPDIWATPSQEFNMIAAYNA